jgi:hypothetical protein
MCKEHAKFQAFSKSKKPITKKFVISSAGFASSTRVGNGEKEAISLPKAQ